MERDILADAESLMLELEDRVQSLIASYLEAEGYNFDVTVSPDFDVLVEAVSLALTISELDIEMWIREALDAFFVARQEPGFSCDRAVVPPDSL